VTDVFHSPEARAVIATTEAVNDEGWIVRRRANPGARIRLFCFPYAGAGAWIYRAWSDLLPDLVEVCGVELPGHGSRIHEPSCTRLVELARQTAAGLRPYLDVPFAVFGHSIGGLLGFEFARTLRREGSRFPNRLFVSAVAAPHVQDRANRTDKVTDGELIRTLVELGGTPREILEDPELADLFLPVVRADLQLLETYGYVAEEALACPISIFGGMDDPLTAREGLEAWRDQTSASFSFRQFPGGHFFLNTQSDEFLRTLSEELERAANDCVREGRR